MRKITNTNWLWNSIKKQKKLNPYHYDAYLLSIDSYGSLGKFSSAIKEIDALEEIFPDNEQILYRKAFILYKLGKTSEAHNVLNDGIKQFPSSAALYHLLGRFNGEEGNAVLALRSFEKALSINPNASDVFLDMGFTFELMGQDEKANLLYNDLLGRFSGSLTVLFRAALFKIKMGQLNEAGSIIERANKECNKSLTIGCREQLEDLHLKLEQLRKKMLRNK